ncbi:hypothetical protein G3A43_38310 [Paraburkholderia aspalathi]|uniref:hypothetical protein n=1 Tax=Paraburkholderia nemoris TaxID=2793076 RepID=UPI00190D7C0E|nr:MULTISPECIES: hypothetical protein [Paraburkholderia]MBK3786077.1 hypothetical protein [Paraburkholderia aspalathi]
MNASVPTWAHVRSFQVPSAAFAAVATCTSACVSVIAAWERGGQLLERLVWVGIGLVVLLAAHLMPALSRGAPAAIRSFAIFLWAVSMIATAYGHAIFFISAQQHAGELRASAILSSVPASGPPPSSTRSLTTVARERARVIQEIETAKLRKCSGTCAGASAIRASLKARVDALDIEMDELRRQQRDDDRSENAQEHQATKRDAATADPVTSRLAQMFRTSTPRVDLIVGLGFGGLLESLACAGWLLALPRISHATQKVVGSNGAVEIGNSAQTQSPTALMPSLEDGPADSDLSQTRNDAVTTRNCGTLRASEPVAERTEVATGCDSRDLARLAAEVAAGRARATVSDIRKHFRCSQQRAMVLRRQFSAAMLEFTRAG